MAKSGKKYVLGKDIDLDREVVLDDRGKWITSKRAEKIAEKVIAQVVGRPSLTGPAKVSPKIKARVPEKLKLALEREAKRQGQTPSALIRRALEEYLDTAWIWWGGLVQLLTKDLFHWSALGDFIHKFVQVANFLH